MKLKEWLRSNATTARLTASYLSIIMILSIGFSIALFKTGAREIGRQIPPDSLYTNQFGATPSDVFDSFFRDRISQGRHELIVRLVFINIVTLLIGAAISYYLARRTLLPIERAMDAQARFSSDASHELRTPLTAIRTKNEVALRNPKLTLADAKKVIKSNLEEAIKLEKLSNGLLRLSKENGKELPREPLLLGELASEAMNQFIAAAQAKKIAIEDSIPPVQVLGDKDSLTQAVAVLIDNAVKYGHEGDTIHLTGRKKGGYGFLSVRDTGPGMRASDLPHIFDRFYRADHSRTRQGENGYGLGLSIAKQIIDQHTGEILVSSTQGEGSTFTIKLPLAAEESPKQS